MVGQVGGACMFGLVHMGCVVRCVSFCCSDKMWTQVKKDPGWQRLLTF